MPDAIFSLLPVRRGSTIASTRIGCWLSDRLGLPLYDDHRINTEGPWDNLFIINGSTLYCKHLPHIAVAVKRAREVFWIQNDYTLPPPKAHSNAKSPFRVAFADRALTPHYWTTCQANSKLTIRSARVNWNVLGYYEGHPPIRAQLINTCALYYGAYRANRHEQFERLYTMFQPGALHISSTSKHFLTDYVVPPFREDFYAQLAAYGLGIYAQDNKSITGGHSPATRFYEMLSVGLPMAFMPDCVGTLADYGYDVSPYVLNERTVHDLIRHREEIAEAQVRDWARDYIGELERQVRILYDRVR